MFDGTIASRFMLPYPRQCMAMMSSTNPSKTSLHSRALLPSMVCPNLLAPARIAEIREIAFHTDQYFRPWNSPVPVTPPAAPYLSQQLYRVLIQATSSLSDYHHVLWQSTRFLKLSTTRPLPFSSSSEQRCRPAVWYGRHDHFSSS